LDSLKSWAPRTPRRKAKGKPPSKENPEILTSTFAFKAERHAKIKRDRNGRAQRALLVQQDLRASLDLRGLPGQLDLPAGKC
jgi:hypothetical protein